MAANEHTTLYDVIVVGAGIEGSSSAYSLAKRGLKVLVLEQFHLPHTRGSSHGQSRIADFDFEEDVYVQMMHHSMDMWETLEREFGKTLLVRTDGVDIRQEGSPVCQAISEALGRHNTQHQVLSPSEFRSRYPMFKVKGNVGALMMPRCGILKADRALEAFQTQFQKLGGTLRDGCPVTSIVPGHTVKVTTPQGVHCAKRLVIAAGPWSGKLTSQLGLKLPLQPCRATVFYWRAREDKLDMHHYSQMPCFVDSSLADDHYLCYGVPIHEYPGMVKVCLHAGPPCDPDWRDQANVEGVEGKAIEQVKRLLPWLEERPAIVEHCIVTKTPDDYPYIGKHTSHPNIVIATGFSGYGFAIAPAIGKTVCELVTDSTLTFDLSLVQIDRFNIKSKI